jgi:uncharacterized cupin superfamily protein
VVQEATLERLENGLRPATDGWFVLNARDARWWRWGKTGDYCTFAPRDRFPELGFNIRRIAPGQPSCLYHSEGVQEDFLVLAGECLAIVEDQERPLGAWDFVHCPADTRHVFVGQGEEPCVMIAVGRRPEVDLFFPRSAVALRRGAGVQKETPDPDVAYSRIPQPEPAPAPELPVFPMRETVREERDALPAPGGWFVVNAADAQWWQNELGLYCPFEREDERFPDLGINLSVLEPGQPNSMYHAEGAQEDFLVLAGECVAVVEDEERRLGAWDLLHCPPGTTHVLVGSGEGPCLLVSAGARPAQSLVYRRSEIALSHGAGVETETAQPREAYAKFTQPTVGPAPVLPSFDSDPNV